MKEIRFMENTQFKREQGMKRFFSLMMIGFVCASAFAYGYIPFDGGKSTTKAGNAVPLSSTSYPFQSVDITAKDTNTGKIYVGSATVSSTSGIFLNAGDSISFWGNNGDYNGDLKNIYINSDVNGEGVTFTGMKPE